MKSEPRRPLFYTTHSLMRIKEAQLNWEQVVDLFRYAEKEKLPIDLKIYNKKKYPGNPAEHYRNGTYIFTTVDINDKRTGKPIKLLVTFTDQRINL